MKFDARLLAPRLNLDAYRKILHQHMLETIAQALNLWLETVLMEIPGWSGASRATFMKLAQAISYDIPIAPRVQSRIGTGVDESAGRLETDKGRYVLHYSTTLPWLIWNEYNNANVDPDPTKWPPPAELVKPGPYNFQMKGSLAFLRFASTVDLPPVASCIKPVRVKV